MTQDTEEARKSEATAGGAHGGDKVPARESEATVPARESEARRLVKIKLQKPFNSKSKGQTINVNNHRFFIPYGKVVEVPFFIAEVVRLSSEQDENTAMMIESMTEMAVAKAPKQ